MSSETIKSKPGAGFVVPPSGGSDRCDHLRRRPRERRRPVKGNERFSLSPQRGEGRGEGCESPTLSHLGRRPDGTHTTRTATPLTLALSPLRGEGIPRPGLECPADLWVRQESLTLPASTTRRDFFKCIACACPVLLAAATPVVSAAQKEALGLVDVNVNLGRWPVRRVPCDEPGPLLAKLRSRGVTQAWAGSLDGLLHKDLGAVNARLADDCRRHRRGLFLPFGSINPKLPGWEQDLQRCVEAHHMRGLRLHPNYHGYRLDDPAFVRLLKLATERRLIVQLALMMEDERMMHPRLRVEPVDTAPLAELVRQTPGLRLVLINALRTLRGEPLRKLISAGEVYVEISMLEGVGGVGALLEQVPVQRVLFGSHAPLFYFEAAELKLRESPLTPEQRRAICQGNAKRLLS